MGKINYLTLVDIKIGLVESLASVATDNYNLLYNKNESLEYKINKLENA